MSKFTSKFMLINYLHVDYLLSTDFTDDTVSLSRSAFRSHTDGQKAQKAASLSLAAPSGVLALTDNLVSPTNGHGFTRIFARAALVLLAATPSAILIFSHRCHRRHRGCIATRASASEWGHTNEVWYEYS